MTHDPQELLRASSQGDANAQERLSPLVYEELRRLAHAYLVGQQGHTLQPTALVHEAFMRLIGREADDFKSQTHFQAVAAKAMRHVLIDYVRGRNREKRGGGWDRVTLSGLPSDTDAQEIDVEALEAALEKLAEVDERGARVVELRFFAGMTEAEIGELLGVSERTVRSDWKMARAWLRSRIR